MISRRNLMALAAGAVSLALAPAAADAAVQRNGQIYLVRGLANIFSTGLDGLHDQLARQGIKSRTVALSDPASQAMIIASQYRSSADGWPVILVGHSLGADEVVHVAAELDKIKVPVALLITLDGSVRGPVTANVRRAVNYYSGLGFSGPLKPGEGFKGRLVNVDVTDGKNAIKAVGHLNIDKSAEIHRRVIAEIKQALHRR